MIIDKIPKGGSGGGGSGINVTIDGIVQTHDLALSTNDTLGYYTPSNRTASSETFAGICVYKGVLYAAMYNDSNGTLRTLDGDSLVIESTAPEKNFSTGGCVVYNNEIHTFKEDDYCHYKWDGDSWTKLSNPPFKFINRGAVVYNNEIHIFGTASSCYNHYKWDGDSWTKLSDGPYSSRSLFTVVYNNTVHVFSSGNHYKWDGDLWTTLNTTPHAESVYPVIFKGTIGYIYNTNNYPSTLVLWDEVNDSWSIIQTYVFGGSLRGSSINSLEWNGDLYVFGIDYNANNYTYRIHSRIFDIYEML